MQEWLVRLFVCFICLLKLYLPFHLSWNFIQKLSISLPQFCKQLSSFYTLDADLANQLMKDDVVNGLLFVDKIQQSVHLQRHRGHKQIVSIQYSVSHV